MSGGQKTKKEKAVIDMEDKLSKHTTPVTQLFYVY